MLGVVLLLIIIPDNIVSATNNVQVERDNDKPGGPSHRSEYW